MWVKGQTEKREREWEELSEKSEKSELNEGEYQRERCRAVLRVGVCGCCGRRRKRRGTLADGL